MTPQPLSFKEYKNIFELEKEKEEVLFARVEGLYKQYGSQEGLTLINQAFQFGKRIHQNQRRESGVPYFTHPIIVALMMMEYKPSCALIAATLLHDAIEDSEEDETEEEVKKIFGPEVYSLIDGVSKVESVEKSKENNNTETLKKLFLFSQKDARALIIKIFDRTHNLLTLSGKKDPAKRKKKAKESLDIYLPSAEFLGMWNIKKILEDACFKHLFPQTYRNIQNAKNKAETLLHETEQKTQEIFSEYSYTIEEKVYSALSLVQKYGASSIAPENTFFIRIVTPSESECYTALSHLNKILPQQKNSLRDYISRPKENGYQAIHSTHIIDDSYKMHFHIVSEDMKAINDVGIFTKIKQQQYNIPSFSLKKIEANEESTEQFLSVLTGDILTEKITAYNHEKGRLSFPKGSTVLDVAITLFPEKWYTLQQGIINSQPVEIFSKLKEDDIIDFQWSDTEEYSRKWIFYVNKPQSKAPIQKKLKTIDIDIQIQEGTKILQEVFDEEKLGDIESILKKNINIPSRFNCEDIQELLAKVYRAEILPEDIALEYENRKINTSTSWKQKICAVMPWNKKKRKDSMTISFQSDTLGGFQAEQLIKKECENREVSLVKSKINSLQHKSSGRITVEAEVHKPLIKLFQQLKTDPRIHVSLFPSSQFFLKIIFLSIIPFIISISIFTVLLNTNTPSQIWMFYTSAFFMAFSNAMGYSLVSKYFSWLRYSIPFLLVFIVTNASITGMYVFLFLQKGYDIYHLDFYFPLLVLLLSMAFPIFFFKRDSSKEKPIQKLSTEEYKAKQKEKRIGYLIRLGAVFVWGMQPILIKYSPIVEIDLHTRAFFIFFGGAIITGAVLLFIKFLGNKTKWNPKIKINRYLVLSIITLIFLVYFVHASLNHTTGTNFILLNNFAPIFALLVAIVLWRHKIPYLNNKKNIIIIFTLFFIGSIGSSFLFYNDFLNEVSGSLLGNSFAIGYMIMDVIFTISLIQYAKYLKDNQSYFVTFYTHLIGAIIILFTTLIFFNIDMWRYSLEEYLWIIGVSMLVGIGIVLNYEAFRRMDGFIAFLMFNISIFITFVVEAFILQEIPATLLLVLGGSLIIGASIFAEVINTRCEKAQIKETK